jgi:hypothetical protein
LFPRIEKDPRGDAQWSVFGGKVSKKQNKNFADKNFNSWTCREYLKIQGSLTKQNKTKQTLFQINKLPKKLFLTKSFQL